jgi:beta-glucosidase
LSVSSDDGIRLYIDGKLLVDSWVDRGETADFVAMTLDSGRQYDVRIEYYENTGGAAAGFGWNYIEGVDHDFQDALDAAKKSDAIVFVAGIIEGEGRDRADLNLSDKQETLIKAVAQMNKPLVVILMTGSAVTMTNWIGDVPAVLQSWYAGDEGGNAIAQALFGEYSPGGKLPITFPLSVGQVPLYYSHKLTGRGDDYVTMPGKPLFPFGHGLNYTTFDYSNLRVAPEKTTGADTITIAVDVKNTGTVSGDEVVQLYTHTPVASVARPVQELKGFKRITLGPGEQKTVTFTLDRKSLEFLNYAMKPVLEPGTIEVMVGSSSADIRQHGKFAIVEKSSGRKHK